MMMPPHANVQGALFLSNSTSSATTVRRGAFGGGVNTTHAATTTAAIDAEGDVSATTTTTTGRTAAAAAAAKASRESAPFDALGILEKCAKLWGCGGGAGADAGGGGMISESSAMNRGKSAAGYVRTVVITLLTAATVAVGLVVAFPSNDNFLDVGTRVICPPTRTPAAADQPTATTTTSTFFSAAAAAAAAAAAGAPALPDTNTYKQGLNPKP